MLQRIAVMNIVRAHALGLGLSCLLACGADASSPEDDAKVNDEELTSPDAGAAPAPLVASRTCGRPTIAPELLPSTPPSSWECTHHDDCSEKPNGQCLLWYDGQCTYADASGGTCDSNGDCTEGSNGRCDFADSPPPACLYDRCASDAECEQGERCVCPELGGDPWCVVNGCSNDADCTSPQTCRIDNGIVGRGPVQRCTTADDECERDADCTGALVCGYDLTAKHWRCVDQAIAD